ncbi:MAG: ferritin-like domain-containing protein [Rhizomicrobium sp.]
MNGCALAFSERTYRRARTAPDARLAIGSEAHKRLFCRALLDTFDPYHPPVLDWPPPDEETRDRLVRLPIWDIAAQTEGKAGLRVKTYGETISDPLLARAVALNAFEEGRHKHVLANLVEACAIALAPKPEFVKPRDPEWAFMVTGYTECVDSFFAFGLFETARRSGFFPPQLVDTFEPVMQEEGRHILFFVNWAAWHRRNLSFWRRTLFDLKRLAVWAFLVFERLSLARDVNGNTHDHNFTVSGANQIGVDISIRELLDICLAENDRRLGIYDRRLLRPRAVPGIVRLARRFLRRSPPFARA